MSISYLKWLPGEESNTHRSSRITNNARGEGLGASSGRRGIMRSK